MKLNKVKVMLDPGAYMPKRAHDTDVGYDLYSPEQVYVPASMADYVGRVEVGSACIHTGVHIALPAGYAGMVKSKSGLNVNRGITSEGVIDPDYTGEIVVKLYNHTNTEVRIDKGMKISQLVIMPVETPEFEQVYSMEKTERGNGGFGSTGAF